ncbi:hypothetical protein [Laspinema palackyanum]|uniref:hypothetical protein n=1 Tax=Laspinema palackyanum TaxID=3231601 RepID=UPI00345DBE75|nr:hypothetical protein [Laspinema sp. D2c]
MTDGDIVHDKLSWRYQRPYKALCEGKDSPDECAWVVMGAMIRDIKKKGAAPILLAQQMGERLKAAIENCNPHSFTRSWAAAVSKELDRLAAGQTSCPYYEKQLVLRASKGILHDFRYGRRMDTCSLEEVVLDRYFQEVYRFYFEERIPLTPDHYAGIDTATLMKRVKALEPELLPAFGKWAKQTQVNPYDVAKLRRPPRQKIEEIDLEENLL